jgi:hypothetical protein
MMMPDGDGSDFCLTGMEKDAILVRSVQFIAANTPDNRRLDIRTKRRASG